MSKTENEIHSRSTKCEVYTKCHPDDVCGPNDDGSGDDSSLVGTLSELCSQTSSGSDCKVSSARDTQLQQIASQLAATFKHAKTASESKPHSGSKIMDIAEELKAAFTSAKPVGSDKLDAAKKDSKVSQPYVPWLSHSSQLILLIAWLYLALSTLCERSNAHLRCLIL